MNKMTDLERMVADALRARQRLPRYAPDRDWWITVFPMDEAEYIPLREASKVIVAALRATAIQAYEDGRNEAETMGKALDAGIAALRGLDGEGNDDG